MNYYLLLYIYTYRWCPSGHGSVYESLHHTGMLDRLINDGKKYIFISNIDNLGATVDLNIINMLANPQNGRQAPEFVMEVTDKTAADVKVTSLCFLHLSLPCSGGHIVIQRLKTFLSGSFQQNVRGDF